MKNRGRWQDGLWFLTIMSVAIGLSMLLAGIHDDNNPFAMAVFILAVAVTARMTRGYFWGILASLVGTFCVNYIFTYPFWSFDITYPGYPLTMAVMLIVSILISALTTQIKRQEELKFQMEREKMHANLLRAIAHDIRTPLAAILGASSALEEQELSSEDQAQLVAGIQRDAQWLVRVTENLLSVTRFSGGDVSLRKEDEVLEEIIGSSVLKYHRTDDSLPVNVDAPGDILVIPMDAMLIEQVLINLFDNVSAHAKGATGIWLSVRRSGDRVIVSVEDDGEGIPAVVLPHVLDGQVRAEGKSEGRARRGHIRSKILIVEDDPGICTFLKTTLGATGYEVLVTGNGKDGLNMIASHCPDCILLDLGLPDMDGGEIISSVRSWTQTPIVVISARSMETDKADALDLGADDYITKPFGTIELLARIRTALRHTTTTSEVSEIGLNGCYRVGELEIDYRKYRVLVHGEDAHLTPNEFRIVALLGKHAGRVMTYRAMLRELWGPAASMDNKILRVHMASIRRKIEPNPNEPRYILTEVGVGYRMAGEEENRKKEMESGEGEGKGLKAETERQKA